MKPRRYALVSLNWSGTSTVGSRTYGWEEDVVGLGADGGCDSAVVDFLKCRIATHTMIPEGFHSLARVVASLP